MTKTYVGDFTIGNGKPLVIYVKRMGAFSQQLKGLLEARKQISKSPNNT